ncbi:hypothetical protein GJ744_004641 [Endocarpon pusillum]|uniref:Uncharacterized protein n=1 Tax=Endocarpon pusillum TaxID=364733 RepID=A0A8H7E6U0_9EURO|nr:hypothetical protein GJ744_004641 [Endocarpon pusillum]
MEDNTGRRGDGETRTQTTVKQWHDSWSTAQRSIEGNTHGELRPTPTANGQGVQTMILTIHPCHPHWR